MLNREKYAKEIIDVALKDETFVLMCKAARVALFMTAMIALYRSRNGRTASILNHLLIGVRLQSIRRFW